MKGTPVDPSQRPNCTAATVEGRSESTPGTGRSPSNSSTASPSMSLDGRHSPPSFPTAWPRPGQHPATLSAQGNPMIYDERTAAVDKLLRKTILPSYARPRRSGRRRRPPGDCDMVEVLNSAWPLMRRTQFNATCHRVAQRPLWATYPDHAWPTTGAGRGARDRSGAAAKSREGRRRPPSCLDFPAIRRTKLEAWCRGEKPCRSRLHHPREPDPARDG